eukprot:gb/GECG01015602.1/.p1 GENE.gb/GECG01015602.1/~~gb/GECG01015602.1/.p1  ORF type:complete len:311 (+),score=44.71 gb/GECG01015602.1/:1-933(+)
MAMDLASMGDFTFLVMIDVFSRMAFVRIIKNKNQRTVINGIDRLLKQMPMKPKTILSDNGGEFTNRSLRQKLQKLDIKQIFSIPSNPQSNSIVERFNGTFKRMLRKADMLSKNVTQKLVDDLVQNYNEMKHDTTGVSPKNALKETNTEQVKQNNTSRRILNLQGDHDNLEKGDTVRTAVPPKTFQKTPITFSLELYEITAVQRPKEKSKPIAYRLKEKDSGKRVRGLWGRRNLQKIDKVENKNRVTVQFDVERILDRFTKKGKKYLKVKWRNFPAKEATIEPESEIRNDMGRKQFNVLLDNYLQRQKKKK